jgi:hypothetical protein
MHDIPENHCFTQGEPLVVTMKELRIDTCLAITH